MWFRVCVCVCAWVYVWVVGCVHHWNTSQPLTGKKKVNIMQIPKIPFGMYSCWSYFFNLTFESPSFYSICSHILAFWMFNLIRSSDQCSCLNCLHENAHREQRVDVSGGQCCLPTTTTQAETWNGDRQQVGATFNNADNISGALSWWYFHTDYIFLN